MSDQQQNNGSDFIIVFVVVLFLGAFFLYQYFFGYFAQAWYILKFPSMLLIDLIPQNILEKMYSWVFWKPNMVENIKVMSDIYFRITLENFDETVEINKYLTKYNTDQKGFMALATSYITIMYLPFIAFLSIFYYKKITSKERHTKKYTVESLGIQESKIWPQIRPVVYEFEKMRSSSPFDSSNWFSVAYRPYDLLEKINVIKREMRPDPEDEFEQKEYLSLDIKKLYKHFKKELGEPWTSPENLNFEEKAILAIILPKIFQETKESLEINDLLATYNSSYPDKENYVFSKSQFKTLFRNPLKFFSNISKYKKNNKDRVKIIKRTKKIGKTINKKIDNIIEKYYYEWEEKKKSFGKKEKIKKGIHPEIQKILNMHFYKRTAFIELINVARKNSGVFASCEVLWVKKYNRDFWYILSQTGRTSAFPEVSGTWSHYLAEQKIGHKKAAPLVKNAIFAADKFMFDTHDNYEPINEY
tara:strand:+ start:12814 stop:14232 length:1419 start_codon:yes stop_codon:yes gene_type:complete